MFNPFEVLADVDADVKSFRRKNRAPLRVNKPKHRMSKNRPPKHRPPKYRKRLVVHKRPPVVEKFCCGCSKSNLSSHFGDGDSSDYTCPTCVVFMSNRLRGTEVAKKYWMECAENHERVHDWLGVFG